jgi:hypothetical protein
MVDRLRAADTIRGSESSGVGARGRPGFRPPLSRETGAAEARVSGAGGGGLIALDPFVVVGGVSFMGAVLSSMVAGP